MYNFSRYRAFHFQAVVGDFANTEYAVAGIVATSPTRKMVWIRFHKKTNQEVYAERSL